MSKTKDQINRIVIDADSTILSALKKMDELGVKLLILKHEEKFAGLISIGDIQRAIIKNIELDELVKNILRDSIYVAKPQDSFEEIKQRMLTGRDECMPIIDEDGNIQDVIFWEDLFQKNEDRNSQKLDIPVVIMAGGKGTRMKPLTNIIPKPLIPIGEFTISEEIIHGFKKLGATNFFMSVNYKAELIKMYFKHIQGRDYEIEYFQEEIPLGTAGSLHLLKDKIRTTFFVTNCDVLVDQDFRDVLAFHRDNQNEITMICSIKTVYIPYGTVTTGKQGKLLSMREKPEISFMINTGVYILEPELLAEIPGNREFHITELIENVIKSSGKVGVFPISEQQYSDIGDWAYYLKKINKDGISK